ncbi:hypothetical protein [Streptosporangium saharense]|uniref:hypothetical protein n=1 Tax=Streptosporangium saharense TaxID=1706840 RepID=UPI00341EC16C
MTDNRLNRATRAAVAVLAYRIREREQLPEQERVDPDLFALRFLTDMLGRGWRLTNARKPVPWTGNRQPLDPETARRGAELVRRRLGLAHPERREQS